MKKILCTAALASNFLLGTGDVSAMSRDTNKETSENSLSAMVPAQKPDETQRNDNIKQLMKIVDEITATKPNNDNINKLMGIVDRLLAGDYISNKNTSIEMVDLIIEITDNLLCKSFTKEALEIVLKVVVKDIADKAFSNEVTSDKGSELAENIRVLCNKVKWSDLSELLKKIFASTSWSDMPDSFAKDLMIKTLSEKINFESFKESLALRLLQMMRPLFDDFNRKCVWERMHPIEDLRLLLVAAIGKINQSNSYYIAQWGREQWNEVVFLLIQNISDNDLGELAKILSEYKCAVLHLIRVAIWKRYPKAVHRLVGLNLVKKFFYQEDLCRVLCQGELDLIQFLHDNSIVKSFNDPVSVCYTDSMKVPPLCISVFNGELDIVKYLVEECHCNVEAKDSYNRTPLHYAIERGHLDIVKYLVEECHVQITDEIINVAKTDDIKRYLKNKK